MSEFTFFLLFLITFLLLPPSATLNWNGHPKKKAHTAMRGATKRNDGVKEQRVFQKPGDADTPPSTLVKDLHQHSHTPEVHQPPKFKPLKAPPSKRKHISKPKPKRAAKKSAPEVRGPVPPPNMTLLDTQVHSRKTCSSNWHAKYIAMHTRAAKILNSVPSEEWSRAVLEEEGLRVFIYIAREGMWEGIRSGGVGDRFSMVGMFAMALAHNTAFFIDYPGLEQVFDSGLGGLSWRVNATGYVARYGYKKTVLHFPDFWGGPLIFVDNNIHKGTLTIARTARGMITFMFGQPYFEKRLRELNFEYETTFGCLFDFLFQPSPLLRREFGQDMGILDKSSDSIKILLQIRAGDTAIVNQHNITHFNHNVLPIVKSFTDCALAMEEKIKSVEQNANKSVIWYLMADSASTRKYMNDTFGDKVFSHKSVIQDLTREAYSLRSFIEVLGEHWCGGLADYFVVSTTSGLGRQAAFRSKQPQNRAVSLATDQPSQCIVASDLMKFGYEYSRI